MVDEQRLDSTGQPIRVGDKVLFKEKEYTIRGFEPGKGRLDTARVLFVEDETIFGDEISVDLVGPPL